jgi:hypothetical protein
MRSGGGHHNPCRSVVLNAGMPLRVRTIAAAAVLAALVCAAPASARIIEIGGTASEATPTCPATPCQAVSRTTGYQAKVLKSRATYLVPADGRIVAWTINLGAPDSRQVDFFNGNFGESSAGLTILRRGKHLFHRVIGQTPIVKLEPYFGQRVQFPLTTSIAVKKGQVVGLTVPTWAPALTQLLNDGSSWRASRAKGKCDKTGVQTAQTKMDQRTQYRCLYRARLTYSATLITNPAPNKKPKT